MDDQKVEPRCALFDVTLKVKITAGDPKPVKEFTMKMMMGQSLLQVMKTAGPDFSFESKDDVPDSGPYVEAVRLKAENGEETWYRNSRDKLNSHEALWDAVLYDNAEGNLKILKPIDLNYKVCPRDTVFLRYSYF